MLKMKYEIDLNRTKRVLIGELEIQLLFCSIVFAVLGTKQ